MNRRAFLSGLLGASVAPAAPSQAAKPNFLFILIDDMGWRDTTCYGSTYYETPRIDALAGQSMKFTNAYAAAPLCSPTRASIMTGKYPARLHLTQVTGHTYERKPKNPKFLSAEFLDQLPLEEVTIAEALKPAGYATGLVGKWHLGSKGFYPQDQGFDVNVGGFESGMPKSFFYPAWKGNPPIDGRDGDYLTDRYTDEAEKFIRQNQDRPFFLYLAHQAVHIPLEAKQAMIEKYKAKLKPGQLQNVPVYAAMVESVDESVGRLTRLLDELKIAERTVVIFTSDNGGLAQPDGKWNTPTSNAPLRSGKGHLYEGGIREPLLIRWPGRIKAGSVCDVPVSSIDFFPTITEMARVRPRSLPRVDGLSLMPLLTGRGHWKRNELYWHFPHYSKYQPQPGGAIRQGDFKLIEYFHDGHLELYNLKDDIGETKNLAAENPRKAHELRNLLDHWRKSVNAWMPRPNPNFDPSSPVDIR